ncbi:NVEALA domain-containing protein [uncultured Rikenella sp.]|uniref:NVEALA domain-containing protein n=1 Tax=uncultured Rikenella sp. TaxID=368003 RepID=UPI00260E63B7|nr:NVEALA domain-containing protein [uncultured Rikenella sp.]
MKKLTKILLAAGGAALIGGGAVMTYLKAQTQQPEMSDLTLQNLEAMATIDVPDMNWANGPSSNVSCSRCGSVHVHCKASKNTRCLQTSCL